MTELINPSGKCLQSSGLGLFFHRLAEELLNRIKLVFELQ